MVIVFGEEEVRIIRFEGVEMCDWSNGYVAEAEWYWTHEPLEEREIELLNLCCAEQIADILQEHMED